jgi:membrane-associated phospholipid phosphatase
MANTADTSLVGTRSTGALWWLAALYGLAVVGAYVFFVRSGLGQRLDDAAFLGRDAVRRGFAQDAESLLGGLGISALAAALAVVGVVAFWRGRVDLSALVLVAVVGANTTTQVLKHFVLERPLLIPDAFRLANSYPSGHVTAVASLALAAVLVTPGRARSVVGLVGSCAGFVTGLATVIAGWHRPSDVIGAWLVVGLWAALATAVVVAVSGTGDPRLAGRASALVGRIVWTFGAVAAAVLVVGSGAWIGLHWADASDPAVASARHGLAMTAGIGGMVAAALLVPASMVSAVRRYSLAPPEMGRR